MITEPAINAEANCHPLSIRVQHRLQRRGNTRRPAPAKLRSARSRPRMSPNVARSADDEDGHAPHSASQMATEIPRRSLLQAEAPSHRRGALQL